MNNINIRTINSQVSKFAISSFFKKLSKTAMKYKCIELFLISNRLNISYTF